MALKNYIFLFLFCTSFACSQEESVSEGFPEVINITNYEVISDNDSLGNITDMDSFNSMIIFQQWNMKHKYSFWSISDFSLLKEWGIKGHGKDEFVDFGIRLLTDSTDLVFVCNAERKLFRVNIDSIISRDTQKAISYKYQYDVREKFCPIDFYPFGNRYLIMGEFFDNDRYIALSDSTLKPLHFVKRPYETESIPEQYRFRIYQGKISRMGKTQRFVVKTHASNTFTIYEIEEDSVKQIFSHIEKLPVAGKKGRRYGLDFEKSIAGLNEMKSTNEYIYFSYIDKSYEKARLNDFKTDVILCFDKNGIKCKKYILPMQINLFCVNANILYAIEHKDSHSLLYKIPLK